LRIILGDFVISCLMMLASCDRLTQNQVVDIHKRETTEDRVCLMCVWMAVLTVSAGLSKLLLLILFFLVIHWILSLCLRVCIWQRIPSIMQQEYMSYSAHVMESCFLCSSQPLQYTILVSVGTPTIYASVSMGCRKYRCNARVAIQCFNGNRFQCKA
jgi:hypothetical protein